MENLISKELLSEVLRLDICKITIKNNILEYDADFDDIIDVKNINIYELAYKCKEWALDKGYMIKSQILLNGQGYSVIQKKENDTQTMGWCADTEYKAIFKATQYIYDNEATDER